MSCAVSSRGCIRSGWCIETLNSKVRTASRWRVLFADLYGCRHLVDCSTLPLRQSLESARQSANADTQIDRFRTLSIHFCDVASSLYSLWI